MDDFMTKGFVELSANEMLIVDGGIDWNFVGGTLAVCGGSAIGAKIGGSIGWLGGPAGSMIGTVVGGVAGAVIYSLWD
jgi:outer membrane lipoprotein SlyB